MSFFDTLKISYFRSCKKKKKKKNKEIEGLRRKIKFKIEHFLCFSKLVKDEVVEIRILFSQKGANL